MQSNSTAILPGVSRLVSAEARMGATVDLPSMEVRIFDTNDSFSDRESDTATQIIKQSLTGELTSENLRRAQSASECVPSWGRSRPGKECYESSHSPQELASF